MKKMMICALTVLGMVGATGSTTPAFAEVITTAHKACNDCHLRGMKLKDIPLNELCLECHPANATDHKLGVIPELLPKGLPLDKEGRITCLTCHEPHGKGTAAGLLRLEPNSLCVSCHPK